MWLNVHKRMGLGRAEFISGSVTAAGQEVPGHGRSGWQKIQPVPSLRLYLADIEWNIRTSANV